MQMVSVLAGRSSVRRLRRGRRGKRHPSKRAHMIVPLLAALTLTPSSPASAGEGFVWSGTCDGGSVVVPVARDDLDPFVPEGFALAGDQSGVVPFAVQFFECRDVVIDGSRSPTIHYTEALVVLDRDRSPALAGQPPSEIDFYVVPTPSSSKLLKMELRNLGLKHVALRGMTFTRSEIAPLAEASGVAPANFAVRAMAAHVTPRSDGSVCCTWQLGSEGLVRTKFEVSGQTFDGGVGMLSAVPGSSMYRIIGEQTKKEGVGVVRTLSFRGDVELMA